MFDGTNIKALYNYKKDWMLTEDLQAKEIEKTAHMKKRVKAIIQSYMERMNNDELVY
jgi:hypothetical protein